MDIGYRLRNLLEEKGITQKELANSLNISATALNGYIKNRRQPDANTLVRLASYFNTTTDYIYGVTSFREPPASSYNAEERHLISIYRTIPDDQKPLFIETGKLFSNFGKRHSAEKHSLNSKAASKPEFSNQA